jgi:hypothetical protein
MFTTHNAQEQSNFEGLRKKKVSLVSLIPPMAQEVAESPPLHSGDRLERTHETHGKRVSH